MRRIIRKFANTEGAEQRKELEASKRNADRWSSPLDEGTVKDQGRIGKIPGALCPSKVSGKSECNEGNSSYGMNPRR